MSHALIRPVRLDLDEFALVTGTHPELIRRLVTLGILDAGLDRAGQLWFSPGQVAVLARAQRLRAGFGLNYAAIGLVSDLLERIAVLEKALRRYQRREGDRGPESSDPEVAGRTARRADQGPSLRTYRGGRRAPAAGAARSA